MFYCLPLKYSLITLRSFNKNAKNFGKSKDSDQNSGFEP